MSSRTWLGGLVVALIAFAVRLLQLDQPAQFDELYHLLAAKSWLADGELAIAEGIYDRTAWFTLAVAGWMAAFGESLEVARLSSVLAGTALVVAVFWWLRQVAGPLAAWLGALLLAFWPDGLVVSQLLRFYALQGLLFWLGAVLVYRQVWRGALEPGRALAAALLLAGACYLQQVSLIGLLGLGIWAALILGVPWARRAPRRHLAAALGGLVLAALAGTALLSGGLGTTLLAKYSSTALWNYARQDAFWYYHLQFLLDYAALWTFTAAALLIGLARHPGPGGFCGVVFVVAFLLHSFAGPKAMRYIYYATPFVFSLWAIALAEVGPPAWRFLTARGAEVLARVGVRDPRLVRTAMLGLVLLPAVLAQGMAIKTVAHLAGIALPTNPAPADWAAARQPLEPWLREAAVVLTTSELEALHYLGRYDLLISRSRLGEIAGEAPDFARDPRTGRPVIASAEALAQVIACYPSGLLVSSESRWRTPVQLSDAVANVVAAETRRIDLEARDMRAYAWNHPAPAQDELPDCAALRAQVEGRETPSSP